MSCCSITELFLRFMLAPYYKNHAAASGAVHNCAKHEEALSSIMRTSGYTQYISAKKLKKSDFGNDDFLCNMPIGSFIEQPFGTHSSPDFFIKTLSNKIIPLEAKSSETTTHPTYNSGGIKQGYYYVFCSKKTNKTTIYRGDDIITQDQQRLISLHIEEEKQRVKLLNERLKALDINKRGVSFYPRPMINQQGGALFTNYFSHQNRERDEQRALDSLS